ncbi:CHAT domain-containing protein [Saccharothrix saharensis]|uniref:CHAT domain-containing protein n=1 Tax=Saccharothrix saharensis TaxID=571190 RepID=UPI00369B6D4D
MALWNRARASWRVQESVAAATDFQQTGDLGALRRAVDSARRAVDITAVGKPHRPLAAVTLAFVLRLRAERLGNDDDVRAAVDFAEEALAALEPDDPDLPTYYNEVGCAHWQAFETFEGAGHLRRSIEAFEAAIAASEPGGEQVGGRSANLANAHRMAYDRFGDLDHLDRAVEIGARAVAAMPDGAASLPIALTALCAARQQRFDATGRLDDLDEAVVVGEQAVTATVGDDPALVGRLSNLALVFLKRYSHLGAAADLDHAVDLLGRAVERTPPDHPDRAGYLSNLGILLRRRAQRTGLAADLRAAVDVGERAVAATPARHPNSLLWRTNLLNTRMELYRRSQDAGDLDEAIALGEQVLTATPADHRQLPRWLSNLGVAYLKKYERTSDAAHLERAVLLGERAVVASSPDHPDHMVLIAELYRTYRARFDATGHRVGSAELRHVVDWIDGATPRSAYHRVQVGHLVGALANAIGEHVDAARALDAAVRALPSVAPSELTQDDREFALARHAGLVSEAVAAHLSVGDAVRAVEAAELGRGVLISAALDLRTDLEGLADVDPALAGRVRWARDRVARSDEDAGPAELARRWRDYEALVAAVRELPGCSRFLLPPGLDELRPPTDGVVVLVNAADARGDALLVGAQGDPVPVRLPDLRHGDALTQVEQLGEATAATGSWAASLRARRTTGDVLAWLWDTIAGPVVDSLPADRLTRVWWLPIGPLSLLPLHAAGHRGRPGVLDRAVSSYTPTLRALAHAHRRPPASTRRQLVIALSSTPGLPPLPATVAEANALADDAPDRLVLLDEDATAARVLTALTTSTWTHFACHADTDPTAPSHGGLHLHDGRLPIGRITGLRLDRAELAYLSACSTARTSLRHADEAIHLVSAFHLAGYRHVIGSLWPLADNVASDAAATFYRELPPLPEPHDFAPALHRVVRGLRDQHPDRPDLWASFIHSGP